jgi:hypothetical protein
MRAKDARPGEHGSPASSLRESIMMTATNPLAEELEEQVQSRTNRGVRNLSIEFRPGRIVLRGQTSSYYVKQLAQHELIHALPADCRLENAITVTR